MMPLDITHMNESSMTKMQHFAVKTEDRIYAYAEKPQIVAS